MNPSEEQQFHFMDLSLDCDASFLKNLATHQVGTGFCGFGFKWFNLSNVTSSLTRTNNYFFQSKLSNSDRNELMGKSSDAVAKFFWVPAVTHRCL